MSTVTASAATNTIRIRGARTHNLQNVDVDLPAGRLIVLTGVSGSGKSSLAFDTLFVEGQRRYLESVAVHTRSLLQSLPRPDVDDISGLPPTVSVDQRVGLVSARSTLAVTTEIYDYLRLLYARAGTAHCTGCGHPVSSQSVDEILQRTLAHPERTRLMVLSPLVRERRGAHREVLERIARTGFVRVRIDGALLDISDCPSLDPGQVHSIDAVIDRIVLKPGIEQRLRESIELACREGDGTCLISTQADDAWQEKLYSTRYRCPACDLNFPAPEPRTFSFSSAWGACAACQGYGVAGMDEEAATKLPPQPVPCPACGGSRLQPFASGVTFLQCRLADFTAQTVDQALLTVQQWQAAANAAAVLDQQARLVAAQTLPDIRQRLQCLQQAGLGYITLDRPTRTLSGGEFQRARLSACLGSGLHGACFVLDEPTTGLHPRDTQRLLRLLQQLRDDGATVVVVEHDGEIMRAADWLIDIGPGAGREGGRLLLAGPPQTVQRLADSPTGRYLRGELSELAGRLTAVQKTLFPAEAPQTAAGGQLVLQAASLHNLQQVTLQLPLQRLVCVTGVSGSGKSSLIMDTLLPIAAAQMRQRSRVAEPAAGAASSGTPAELDAVLGDCRCQGLAGLEAVARVIAVDASALPRHARSCIATISGVWDSIRRLFAKTRDARARGFRAQRFSFNAGEGRCAACRGTGVRNLQMKLLPDAEVPCPACRGRRFNQVTLSVRFNQRSVADVLEMRVDEAAQFFSEFSQIHELLDSFCRIGLGYLTLGQPASTFSGGEAQRVRLATELAQPHREQTLYIMDEPTSGLHPADVCRLVQQLRDLVTAGHSVIVVEHNPDVMRAADWIVDMGPDAGAAGGQVLFSGPANQLMNCRESLTAAALRGQLD